MFTTVVPKLFCILSCTVVAGEDFVSNQIQYQMHSYEFDVLVPHQAGFFTGSPINRGTCTWWGLFFFLLTALHELSHCVHPDLSSSCSSPRRYRSAEASVQTMFIICPRNNKRQIVTQTVPLSTLKARAPTPE